MALKWVNMVFATIYSWKTTTRVIYFLASFYELISRRDEHTIHKYASLKNSPSPQNRNHKKLNTRVLSITERAGETAIKSSPKLAEISFSIFLWFTSTAKTGVSKDFWSVCATVRHFFRTFLSHKRPWNFRFCWKAHSTKGRSETGAENPLKWEDYVSSI